MKFEYKFTLNRALCLQEETGINIFDEDLNTLILVKEYNELLDEGLHYTLNAEKLEERIDKENARMKEINSKKKDTKEEFEKAKEEKKILKDKIKNYMERHEKELTKSNDIYKNKLVPLNNKITLSRFKYAKTCIPFFIDEDYYFDDITPQDVNDFFEAKANALDSGYMRIISENSKSISSKNDGDKGK